MHPNGSKANRCLDRSGSLKRHSIMSIVHNAKSLLATIEAAPAPEPGPASCTDTTTHHAVTHVNHGVRQCTPKSKYSVGGYAKFWGSCSMPGPKASGSPHSKVRRPPSLLHPSSRFPLPGFARARVYLSRSQAPSHLLNAAECSSVLLSWRGRG